MTTTTRNIIEELKRAATEQGTGEAVRTIAGPALETWMRALDGKDADPERLDDLATLMTARLAIRDAALIAAVEPKLDTATVIDMAARPHASNNKTLLTETLNAAFDDPHIRPDETRLARAVRESGPLPSQRASGENRSQQEHTRHGLETIPHDARIQGPMVRTPTDGHRPLVPVQPGLLHLRIQQRQETVEHPPMGLSQMRNPPRPGHQRRQKHPIRRTGGTRLRGPSNRRSNTSVGGEQVSTGRSLP